MPSQQAGMQGLDSGQMKGRRSIAVACLLMTGTIVARAQDFNVPQSNPSTFSSFGVADPQPNSAISPIAPVDLASLPDAPSSSASNSESKSESASGNVSTVAAIGNFLNASSTPRPPYIPLSMQQKFVIFLKTTYSPYTFLGAAFDASWAQMFDDWPAYGQGMEGYGKRYGALLADREAASFFGSFLLPSMLHQDPRYFRLGQGNSVWHRVAYAASRVGITRSDEGNNTFNSSLVASTLLVKGLTNAYYPEPDRGFSDTMGRFGSSLLGTAETNILREYWPDIKHLWRKHEPDRIKKIEQKMPYSRTLDPEAFSEGAEAGTESKPVEATGASR